MKKTILTREIEINAAINEVWKVVSDFGGVSNISPTVSKSQITSEQKNQAWAPLDTVTLMCLEPQLKRK